MNIRGNKIGLIFFIVFFYGALMPLFCQTFYVDPVLGNDENNGLSVGSALKTLPKAQEKVRQMNQNMNQDIVVYLLEGTYELTSTLFFGTSDGGTNGFEVIYSAYLCDQPVVSGGHFVHDWEIHDSINTIYKTKIENGNHFRQLYINDQRVPRARRVDASGWIETNLGYVVPNEVNDWQNIIQVEVVAHQDWKCHRGAISHLSNNVAVMKQPYWNNAHIQAGAPPVWIENAYELLDEPLEWYLDYQTDTLYFKPEATMDMNEIEAIFPKLDTLIELHDVAHLKFKNIYFEHGSWTSVNTSNGFACDQAESYFDYGNAVTMPGNIFMDYCHEVVFDGCVFQHLGATGIKMFLGCQNNQIRNCTFTDISGSAIAVGDIYHPIMTDSMLVVDNVISNNLINRVAQEYEGCVGIFGAYTNHTIIAHNEIKNLPYSGISWGWGWSNDPTDARNNIIAYNRIDSIVTVLRDGGGIYTLSAQEGTQIHHNYISNHMNDFGALFPDEGSSFMRWHHNVLDNINGWLHMWTPTILSDTVDYNYYNNAASTLEGTNCIIENNVEVIGNNWPPEALEIMNIAGRIPYSPCGTAWHIKVFLQGNFNPVTNTMNDDLRQMGVLPLEEPYQSLGYLNQGGETIADSSLFHIEGDNAIVDWLLLELRDGTNPTEVVATRSALLQRDGDVVDTDGISPIRFGNVIEPMVYLVIRHRNHLGVRTSNTFDTHYLDNYLDFTVSTFEVFGIEPMINIGSVRLLIAGDSNNDGQINPVDKNDYWRVENGNPFDYFNSSSDYNLDGSVNPVDKNGYWRSNNSKVEQLE